MIAATDQQEQQATKAARRARAYLCDALGLAPDADDAHILAKDPNADIPTPAKILLASIDATLAAQDDNHWLRLSGVVARALKRADRPTRLQVLGLLGLGDLD